jgi:hypothetical protein
MQTEMWTFRGVKSTGKHFNDAISAPTDQRTGGVTSCMGLQSSTTAESEANFGLQLQLKETIYSRCSALYASIVNISCIAKMKYANEAPPSTKLLMLSPSSTSRPFQLLYEFIAS